MLPGERPYSAGLDETSPMSAKPLPGRERVVSQRLTMLKAHSLIDKVYNWNNLWTAWRKVRANKGAHGLDRVTIRAFERDAETHLKELQRKLMENRFEPQLVRRVIRSEEHTSELQSRL